MGDLSHILDKIKTNSNNKYYESTSSEEVLLDNYVDDVYNYFTEFTECEYLLDNGFCSKKECTNSENNKCSHVVANTYVLCEYSKCQEK